MIFCQPYLFEIRSLNASQYPLYFHSASTFRCPMKIIIDYPASSTVPELGLSRKFIVLCSPFYAEA